MKNINLYSFNDIKVGCLIVWGYTLHGKFYSTTFKCTAKVNGYYILTTVLVNTSDISNFRIGESIHINKNSIIFDDITNIIY